MWKVDRQTPIFTSPNATTYLTVVSNKNAHYGINTIVLQRLCGLICLSDVALNCRVAGQ